MPEIVILDNGPEFLGTAFDAWAAQHGVTLHVIQPGKQVRNVFIEKFTGKIRDECLNELWFLTSPEAQVVVEAWRKGPMRANSQCDRGCDPDGVHSTLS